MDFQGNKPDTALSLPLVVDLDGTLVATDTLLEAIIMLVRENPVAAFTLPLWMVSGRAFLKRQVASRVRVAVAMLPYRQDVLSFLRAERQRGRTLVLATASDRGIAEAVARHLGLFSVVLASDGTKNISGRNKALLLRDRYGDRGFDYLGNSHKDLVVWRHARRALVVPSSSFWLARFQKKIRFSQVFKPSGLTFSLLHRLLRCRQWIKNILVFVPLLAAHQFTDIPLLLAALGAFMAFNFAASGIYIVNDFFDLDADRRHPTKRHRPLACGEVSPWLALAAVPFLLFLTVGIAWWLPFSFLSLLLLYAGLSGAYSLYLKRLVLIDVVLLASLYTVRIFAGAAAVAVPVSWWLAAFSLFIFFSLALVKRFCELQRLYGERNHVADGRRYVVSDMQPLSFLGISSGMLSVVVFTLYINSVEVTALYRQPYLLWLVVPLLLYWIGRVWLLAHRGNVHEDPIVFATRDTTSFIVAGLIVALMLLAI